MDAAHSAAISAFNAAVDASRFSQDRDARLSARIDELDRRLAEVPVLIDKAVAEAIEKLADRIEASSGIRP